LQLSVEKRIGLFEQVLEAVDYAHRNLVVHRDLKPSNILVTAQGQVKLLDFGTSRLTDEDSGTTLNRALTPRYASPEQLRGQPLTTATDIFSLGVMLYELLSGRWPFGDPESAADAWRRVGQEAEPSPVDHRELGGISKSLAGDLNAILFKALEHSQANRYRSVEELRWDLRRFAAGRAVLARKQTSAYRLRKFSWRYRWQLAGLAVVLLALVGATVLSVRQARAERQHAAVAQRESERARRLAQFTTQTLLAVSPSYQSPLAGSPAAVTITDLVDNAARRVGPAFRGDPAGEAEMRGTIGKAYAELGQLDKARPLLERALAMARTIGPGFENQLAAILAGNCDLASFRGEVSLARRLCQESFDTLNRAANPDPEFQFGLPHELAYMMYNDGAPLEDVERLYLQSAAAAERNFGRQDVRWAIAMTRVGESRLRAGKAPEAGQILRDVLGLMRSLPGPPIEILGALRAMAGVERVQGQYGKSGTLLKEALSVFDKKPAAFYSRTELEVELLYVQTLAGRATEAVPRALALARGPEPEAEVRARGFMVAGRQAEPWLRKAVDLYRAQPANRAVAHAEALNALAECLSRLGRAGDAAQVSEEARKRAAEGSAYTARK
jgi:eukaryotic-like serine/threonine-protein kinase